MLKAQLLKHLLHNPSDRRLAFQLKHNKKAAKADGFRKGTPSRGLFTQFRHHLGEETYLKTFNNLLRRLLESGVVKGEVIAVDSNHLKAYSQRSKDNKTGRSDPDETQNVAMDRPSVVDEYRRMLGIVLTRTQNRNIPSREASPFIYSKDEE